MWRTGRTLTFTNNQQAVMVADVLSGNTPSRSPLKQPPASWPRLGSIVPQRCGATNGTPGERKPTGRGEHFHLSDYRNVPF